MLPLGSMHATANMMATKTLVFTTYLMQARRGDYVSKVAWGARIQVEDFLYDNVDIIRDLDKPLEGLKLRLCNPFPGGAWAQPLL